MKKRLILCILLINLFVWTATSLAAEQELLHFKLGINSTGLEIEKIFASGTSLHLSETMYRRVDKWNTTNSLEGETSIAYTTMAGLRKHIKLLGQNIYLGGALGLSGLDPALNTHIGYQIQIAKKSNPMYLRVEGGWSLIFEFTQDSGLESKFQFGIGIGSPINLDISKIYY